MGLLRRLSGWTETRWTFNDMVAENATFAISVPEPTAGHVRACYPLFSSAWVGGRFTDLRVPDNDSAPLFRGEPRLDPPTKGIWHLSRSMMPRREAGVNNGTTLIVGDSLSYYAFDYSSHYRYAHHARAKACWLAEGKKRFVYLADEHAVSLSKPHHVLKWWEDHDWFDEPGIMVVNFCMHHVSEERGGFTNYEMRVEAVIAGLQSAAERFLIEANRTANRYPTARSFLSQHVVFRTSNSVHDYLYPAKRGKGHERWMTASSIDVCNLIAAELFLDYGIPVLDSYWASRGFLVDPSSTTDKRHNAPVLLRGTSARHPP